MDNIIEIKNLSHIYSANTPFEHIALHNMNLTIKKGEILGIIGHTGSGKSTLIQHLNGLLKPTEGTILYSGRDIWSDKATTRDVRFHVGLVFQYPEYQLFEETCERDIAFGPTNMGLSQDEVQVRVLEAAASVGLDSALLSKSPFDLSGGQKRRVALAGVIAMRPDVLILDEPTAGLDPHGREEILSHITEYNRKTGATIIFVTHSMEDIAKTVDRIIVLEKGSILMSGKPREIFSKSEELSRAGLTVPQVTQVMTELHRLGVPVDRSVFVVKNACDSIRSLYKGGTAHA